MSCGHGWHGCGPWAYGPYAGPRYEPADWYEEADWPLRGRARRYRAMEHDAAPEALEARVDELRDEIRRLEAELVNLRGVGKAVADKT
jgi:hypothetical protein